jgi:HEAT repeat protein
MGDKCDSAPLGGRGQSSRSHLRWNLAVLTMLLFFGLVWFLTDHAALEPVYRDKGLRVWLQTYDPSLPKGRGSKKWSEADDAVRHIGTNAIPILLQMLRERDSSLKYRLAALAQRQSVIKIHVVPPATQHIEASRAFIVLGDGARDAVPELMKIFNENNSAESQSAVELALGWIGPAAKQALPLLLQATSNANNQVRENALSALGDVHAEPERCVPVLIQALGDSDYMARTCAAHALGKFGTDARSAVPALEGLTNRPSFNPGFTEMEVQFEAFNALQRIDSNIFSPPNEKFSKLEMLNMDPLIAPP